LSLSESLPQQSTISLAPAGDIPATRWSAHKLFLVFAPLIYAAFALLTPPFQTPDEHQHLMRAWQLSELQLTGEQRGSSAGGVLPASLADAIEPELGTVAPHADRPLQVREFLSVRHTSVEPEAKRYYSFTSTVFYSPLAYVPQVTAVWLGRAAHLSIEEIVFLGRLLNAAMAIMIFYFAIRIAPVAKSAILFTSMLPMTAALAASFGQDGFIISLSCLLIALSLKQLSVYKPAGTELSLSASAAIAITLSKYAYLPLAVIAAGPIDIRQSTKAQWAKLIALLLITCTLTAVWLSITSESRVPVNGLPSLGERLHLLAADPALFPKVMYKTYNEQTFLLLRTAFTFGWLNIGPVLPAAILSLIAAICILVSGDRNASNLTITTRAWFLLVAASIIFLVSFSLYIYWTPPASDLVVGLQGRYFIPLVPLLLIASLPNRGLTDAAKAFSLPLLLIANGLSLLAIVNTFYV
jgi:uncharacterized membrane protein